MINQATFKIRLDSLQSSLNGETLTAMGYCSLQFRDRAETVSAQIEFRSQGPSAYQLQEAGIRSVGIAMGSIEVYPPVPEQGQPNHRTILKIQNFTPVTAASTQRQQRQPQQPQPPRQQRQPQQSRQQPPRSPQQRPAPAPVPVPPPVAAPAYPYSPPPTQTRVPVEYELEF